jgi:hypothetical protein
MKFETIYRRLLHAELDALLDVSENVRVGVAEHHDRKMLNERTVRKVVFDEFLRAYIVANRGKSRVVDMLREEIATNKRMIEFQKSKPEPNDELINQHEMSIAMIDEMIAKLDK